MVSTGPDTHLVHGDVIGSLLCKNVAAWVPIVYATPIDAFPIVEAKPRYRAIINIGGFPIPPRALLRRILFAGAEGLCKELRLVLRS